MNIVVTVCMITYNHEKYIAQAIDSVLMQKTNFHYEIVIGEDYSTDKTREIVLEYKAKYPDKIKLLLQEINVGMMQNFTDTLKACKGKYIALLEGDDYWTDPYKLQKQVDYLDSHPEYSFCFHNAYVHDEDINKDYLFNNDKGAFFKKNLVTDRTVEGWELINKWVCPTASIVFRNNYNLDYELFKKTKYGDIVLILFLAEHGKVFYFNQVSSGYRRLLIGQRKAYSGDLPGKIAHYELLIDNFKDIPYLQFVCSKHLSDLTYSYAVTQLRKKGIKGFKKNIRLFKKYFVNVLQLKSPVSKFWFLLYILYENLRVTAKALIN